MSDGVWRRLVPAMLGLGLGLSALLAFSALATWLRLAPSEPGSTYGFPPDVPLATDKSLGINADLGGYDDATQSEILEAMEGAGFRWLRHRFPWDAIEPKQGVYNWATWDEIVESVIGHNIGLIAVLDGSPGWARAAEDAGNPLAPPVGARDYGTFVATFAERYGDRIDYYQIWDEPNIEPHWGAREIDPASYAQLLREGAIQIRAADPEATILLAALAPNVEPGGANMSDLLFLDALYGQGAAEWFDVVAAQLYGFDDSPDALPDPNRLNWRRISLLREVMKAHGDRGTAVWAVAFGWGDGAAEILFRAVGQARQGWPWLGPMLWAAWSPGETHGEYALTSAGGQPGTVYRALQVLATAPAVAWPGVYPADHPSGHYEGDWRVTPLGADIGSSGDKLTVPFRGTRLDLTVRRGDYRAFLFASVDGQPANALPRDNEGHAYIVLHDPLQEVDNITLARNLSDGDHVAEIVAERGWGQWAILGWIVAREVPTRLPWLPVALGLTAVVAFGFTIYRYWSYRYKLLGRISLLLDRCCAIDDRLALVLAFGAAILVYVTIGTIPSLIALGLLAGLFILRPEIGLPLIVLALPVYQSGKPLLGKVFSMVEILTLLTAVGWSVNRVLGIGHRYQGTRARERVSRCHVSHLTALDWGVVALVAVGAASLLWAEHGREAAREFRSVILEAAIFYGLLRAMIRERREVWRVADAWVLGGALIALVGVCQWVLGHNLITAEGVWRVRGFYGSPNNLALYLGRVFPLAVVIAVWGHKGRHTPRRERSARPWAYALAAGVMVAALILTYSRGAWLLGVPAAILFLAAMRGRRTLAVSGVVMILMVVVAILVIGVGRLTSLLDTAGGTTFFRLQLWQSSLAMIRDHPLLGVGLDNFLYFYRTHYVLPTAWEEFSLSHPHNLVLDFWLRLGVLGLLVLVWLLIAFFWRGWQAHRRLPENNERLLALGLMGGMVNFVFHGLVDNAFFLVDLGFVFMFMAALIQTSNDGYVDAHKQMTGGV